MNGTYWLKHGDAVEWLRGLPDESVDLVVTDPPYESLEKHRAIGTTTRLKQSKGSSNAWFSIFPNHRFPELFTEVYRVLKPDSHFYLYCDPETMFVAKPMAERAGFKFWKPLVWDKCLGPDTPVWTARGVIRAADVTPSDRVMTPAGALVNVLATRRTRAPAVRIALSDGSAIVASRDHRFVVADGTEVEAADLHAGTQLGAGSMRIQPALAALPLGDCVDEDDRVLEMPDPTQCLFCGRGFEGVRAAAAHQARFCEKARSKEEMAESIGVAAKRLRRWMSDGRLPARWARELGLEGLATGRVRGALQNDKELWFPEQLRLDYGWGKLVGLFAAEGWRTPLALTFALHADEKHLQNHIARTVRALGLRAEVHASSEHGCTVTVCSKVLSAIMGVFVGGADAVTKHILPAVYAAPHEFQRGVFDGLIEGDGHWSHDEQRETLHVASLDLASFALRFARELGFHATMRRFENDAAGGWKVRFDPRKPVAPITVASVEEFGETDLVDIAIDDPRQLYLLGNGVITHNCRIGMGYHYRARYEFILFFEKGKRKLHDLGVADIISAPRIAGGYPAEKPVSVSEVLIKQSSDPGQLVVDPFMGSASVCVAAVRQGRHAWGSDVCEEAIEVAKRRLADAGASERVPTFEAAEPPVQAELPL